MGVRYNYSHFGSVHYESLKDGNGIALGDKLPELQLKRPDGEKVALDQFVGRPLVLQTGSITCPLYVNLIPAMNVLAQIHPQVCFAVIYVREAHPGAKIGPHQSLSEKLTCARDLGDLEPENRLILVDSLEGQLHQSLGAFPNMGFVFSASGELVFRSDWLNVKDIETVLEKLETGDLTDSPRSRMQPASFGLTLRVLNRAGSGAKRDYFMEVPKIALRLFKRWLTRKTR